MIVELLLAVDTGSSDLWIHTPKSLNATSQTQVAVNLSYGIGSASGKIAYGPMYIGDYFIPQQGAMHYTVFRPKG